VVAATTSISASTHDGLAECMVNEARKWNFGLANDYGDFTIKISFDPG